MTNYLVVSREYTAYDRIQADIHVPEITYESAEVEADTPTQAKVLAVRQWRAEGHFNGLDSYCASDENPFTGLKVQVLDMSESEFDERWGLIIDLCNVLRPMPERME